MARKRRHRKSTRSGGGKEADLPIGRERHKATPLEAMVLELIDRQVKDASRTIHSSSARRAESQSAYRWIMAPERWAAPEESILTLREFSAWVGLSGAEVQSWITAKALVEGEHYVWDDSKPLFFAREMNEWMNRTLLTFEQCCDFVHLDPDYVRSRVERARLGDVDVQEHRLQRFGLTQVVAA